MDTPMRPSIILPTRVALMWRTVAPTPSFRPLGVTSRFPRFLDNSRFFR